MARELKTIDISGVPELLRIVEEVRTSHEPRVLRRDDEDVAILRPVKAKVRRKAKTKAAYDAFLASAGSWQGLIDAEEFKAYIDECRRNSSRPPVEL